MPPSSLMARRYHSLPLYLAHWAPIPRRKRCVFMDIWTCSRQPWRMAGTASPSPWWSETVRTRPCSFWRSAGTASLQPLNGSLLVIVFPEQVVFTKCRTRVLEVLRMCTSRRNIRKPFWPHGNKGFVVLGQLCVLLLLTLFLRKPVLN